MKTITVAQKTAQKWSPFNSTNFTLQSLTPLIVAVMLLVGVPEELTTQIIGFFAATAVGGIGFWGTIREYFKDGIGVVWNSNVLTYLFTFLMGLFPWLAGFDIQGAIGSLIDGFVSGNFNLILAAAFNAVNILYKLVTTKPWNDEVVTVVGQDEKGQIEVKGKIVRA